MLLHARNQVRWRRPRSGRLRSVQAVDFA